MRVRPEIAALPPYRPGADHAEPAPGAGPPLVRLDNNEAPWPPFPEALRAIERAARDLNRYPEISCRGIVEALADFHQVPGDRVVVGSGSVSLIRTLALVLLSPGDEIVVTTPPYPAYGVAGALMGATVQRVPARSGAPDLEGMLARVGARTRLVFVASPHNPTGGVVNRRALEGYLERIPDHVVTVLDQAYHEYVTDPEYADGRAYLDAGKPLAVLRTFSKVYGLAGLRVGYAFATPALREAMERARENFPVSSLGQGAAIASLTRPDLVRERSQATAAERARLRGLCDTLGLAYTPSEGNFLFVDLRRDAKAVCAALRQRGVLVRSGDVHGAPTWVRVTVGSAEDTGRFDAALREALAAVPEAAAPPSRG
jgi:histidinol-phosphate aminotransferase